MNRPFPHHTTYVYQVTARRNRMPACPCEPEKALGTCNSLEVALDLVEVWVRRTGGRWLHAHYQRLRDTGRAMVGGFLYEVHKCPLLTYVEKGEE